MDCNFHGICTCKPDFTGEKCDQCKEGFENFPKCDQCAELYYDYPDCKPCPCSKNGTESCYTDRSFERNVICVCKENFTGEKCDQCEEGFYGPECKGKLLMYFKSGI